MSDAFCFVVSLWFGISAVSLVYIAVCLNKIADLLDDLEDDE